MDVRPSALFNSEGVRAPRTVATSGREPGDSLRFSRIGAAIARNALACTAGVSA
jgi:hypothetical protein